MPDPVPYPRAILPGGGLDQLSPEQLGRLLRDVSDPAAPGRGPYTPPRQAVQPSLAPLRVPGDAYDAALPAPPPPPSDWDVANAALSARRGEINALLATPYTGTKRAVKGMAVLGRAFPQDDDFLQRGGLPSPGPTPSLRETAGGAADVLGGAAEASTLLLPSAMAKYGVARVGAGVLAGMGTASAVTAAGEHLGIPKEYVDLAAQGLGLAGGIAASHVAESPELQAKILSEAHRLYTDDSGVLQLPPWGGPKPEVVTGSELSQANRASKVGEGVSEGAAVAPPNIAEIAKRLFPKLDAYSKPAGLVSSKTILKRLDTMPDLAPEIRASLERVAAQIGDRRAMPEEVQALARGETYTPDRIVRRVRPLAEGEKQIVGAPLGISNARQARGLREHYLSGIEQGVEGRDWYHDTGRSILFHANDDPARARLVAGDIAITSPATSVSANTGMAGKGYNQANANLELPPGATPVKVETGRFPTAMGKRIEELHAGGEASLGLKRDPFARNMAIGGGFDEVVPLSEGVDLIIPGKKTRAVHDIWDAELHGYTNPDGTPMRTGFGPAQHRFMDQQQDKIVAAANQRAIGGHTDWSDLSTQAAGWTGAKVNAGDMDPSQAALSPADYFPEHYAQGSRETLPGPTTGHMPQLLGPGMEPFRRHLHNTMLNEAGIYDSKGRDQITANFGGLVGRSFEGPGLYKGEISPGMQTHVITGSEDVPNGPTGARQVDEGSRRLMNASEATYALGMGQDVGAWSRNLPAGSGEPRGLWDVVLPGGTITTDQLKWLALRYPNIGDMAVISTDDGVRLGNMDPATARSIVKQLGGKIKKSGAGLGTGRASGYLQNDYRVDRAGQQFLDPIRLMGTNRFDDFAPAMFDRIRRADAMFRRDTGGRFSLSQMRDELLGTVAGEGFQGLERLAKKYAISVTLLVAGLQALGQPVPEQPQGQPPG